MVKNKDMNTKILSTWIQKSQVHDFKIINTCRVLSGEIGLGEKQDVHAHIFRPHPFYQQLSISRFAYFRLTLQQIPLHSQNNLFLPVSVFLQFVKRFPSILLSVELFLA